MSTADAASGHGAGQNHDDIGPKGGKLRPDRRLGALAYTDHRDHRADADDDAEHSESGTETISAEDSTRHRDGHHKKRQ